MPGIVGFTCFGLERSRSIKILRDMQDMITYRKYYVKDELFSDGFICATRSHIDIIQKEPQPYKKDGIYIWMDGEINNQDELIMREKVSADTDLEVLYELIKKYNNYSFLKNIDGFYSAVIYDSINQTVHLITDRYGLRHLYWTVFNGNIAWSSEVKAILELPGFTPIIDKRAIGEFIRIGYLLEDRTWFEGVELISPGTILTWDIRKKILNRQRYWWWNEIKPYEDSINEEEIAEELGRLFIKAVERRTHKSIQSGVLLSGGLDSRAILAAMPVSSYPINVLTFGKENCDDIRIASIVAKEKKAIHHVFEITNDNWLIPRLAGIWFTDGQLNIMHMHGIEAVYKIRGLFKINLNGFAGDLILGGSYLNDKRYLDRVNKEIIAEAMQCSPDNLEKFKDYLKLRKPDFYFLQNHVRRFTFGGTKCSLTEIEHKKPFFDNKLIDFVYSLPDLLRYRSNIYIKMLLKNFPNFYKKIPWKKTGVPISRPMFIMNAFYFGKRVRRKLLKELNRYGINSDNPYNYTDYPNWLRRDPGRSFCTKVFNDPSAIYPHYVLKNQVIELYTKHLSNEDHSELICRYLTIEIWLQQVFEGKYLQEKMRARENM